MSFDPVALVELYGHSPAAKEKPDYFRLHCRRYIALLQALDLPPGSRVLEVGCNPGQFTELLVQAGYRVAGLDLHPEDRPALWQRLGIQVQQGNLECGPLPFAEASFEGVIFSEVMEHLAGSPLPVLEEIRRVLLPGGLLVLSTPNARYLRERLVLGWRLFLWRSLEAPQEFRRRMELRGEGRSTVHQRLYTAEEVRWLLERAGFTDGRVRFLAAREGVGVEARRLLRRPWGVVPKALLWGVTALLPPLRSTLLATARKKLANG